MSTVITPWPTKTLAELGAEVTSGSRGWAAYYAEHGSLFVRITNLTREKIWLNLNKPRYVEIDNRNSEATRTRLAIGDLLVSITADIGIIGYVDGTVPAPAYINQHIARVRLDPRLVDSRFVAYYLSSWDPQRNFVGSTDTGAKAGINLATVARLQTVVPTIFEQRQIAEALSDVDSLIATIELLIEKKRAIKQGMVEQLLTGRVRLPGFSSRWERETVKQVVSTPVTDGPHLTPRFLTQGVPFLSVNNLVDGGINWTDVRFISRSDHELFSKKCQPKRGDVLLGKAASVGKVAYLDADIEVNIWSPIALIRTRNSIDAKFVYYQLQSRETGRQIELLTNTSSQGNIGMREIEKIELDLPPLDEQRAIVDILSEIDADMQIVERRLAKARAIKTGMMQQLLSGRTRLPMEVTS